MIRPDIPRVRYLIGRVNALRMLLRSEFTIQNPHHKAKKITKVSLYVEVTLNHNSGTWFAMTYKRSALMTIVMTRCLMIFIVMIFYIKAFVWAIER